jgi:ATP-dependent DNA ligase
VVKDGPTVRLYSRRGHDWGKRLAVLTESLQAIPTRSAILDAELCLPGRDGVPNFYGLLARMHRRQHELAVYAFDLLQLGGEDLRSLTLIKLAIGN